MINVVIIENNLHYAKNILNTVINRFNNFRVIHIVTTVKEGLRIITNNHIDLIFLDLKLPDDTGIKIIEKINAITNIKKPNIVIISGNVELSNIVKRTYNDLNVINKLSTSEFIYNEIKRIINELNYLNHAENIKQQITNELKFIGYDFKYKGTQYILEAIIDIISNNNLDLLDNLEKNVYKYIAYKHNKSINNIKTNIIKATNYIYLYQNPEIIKTYFQLDIKLTPKLVISTVLNKII